MQPTVIAITNQKGGVGKTTTAINVGASLALHHKKKVLLMDLDQQGNLTDGLGIQIQKDQTILEALLQTSDHMVYPYGENLDIIPADRNFSTFEPNINHPNFAELKDEIGQENLLKEYISNNCQDYEFILVDCPPDLNLVTINALVAANKVMIPLRAHGFSLKGLHTVLNLMTRLAKRLNKDLDLAGVFFTEHDERQILSRDLADEVREAVEGKVFRTFVRKNISLAESTHQQMDVYAYDQEMEQESNGAIDYRNLANELLGLEIESSIYERKRPADVLEDEEEVVGNTELASGFQEFLATKKKGKK